MIDLMRYLHRAWMLVMAMMVAGCGPAEAPEEVYDNEAEVQAFYAANPERFVFAKPEDLRTDLNWQNGEGMPTFGDPRAKRGGTLTFRVGSMQETLRIVGPDANSTLRAPIISANTVSLIERHPFEDGYIPGLARQWAVDPDDSRTIYFQLDPDARWSDGRPFTADDVFFSLYFLLSPHLQAPAVNRVSDENVTRIVRYDELTLSITQTKPTQEPLYAMTGFTLAQREFYREFGEDYVERYHWRFAPVTGAYVYDNKATRRGRAVSFKRVDDWWANDKPFYRYRFNPDRMTYVVIRDDNKAFESFMLGEIDWQELDETESWYDHAGEEPFVKGYIERAWVYDELPAPRDGVYINAMQPILSDRNVRLGIQHAMNYERVDDGLYSGDMRRIRSFADGYGAYSHPTLEARTYDIAMAQRYFAEAGYSERGDDGVLVNSAGERLSFAFTVANRNYDVERATILKEEAMKAGLELMIENLDRTAFFTKTYEKNHQIALHSWSTGYSPLPAFEWELRGVDAGKPSNFNTTNIKDEQLDEHLALWDTLDDPEEGQKASHRVQERIHEFAAWVPGITADYSRWGYWRWVRWPDYFQVPRYFFFEESGVFWIDEERKRQTEEARREGSTYPPVTEYYERWKR